MVLLPFNDFAILVCSKTVVLESSFAWYTRFKLSAGDCVM